MSINTKLFIEENLKIKTKGGDIQPLILNAPQMKLYNALAEQHEQGKPQRAIVLKARQMGFSTSTEAIIFKRTATRHNVTSCIVAHQDTATTNLFNMFKLYYDKLPDIWKPQRMASNAKEVIFNTRDGEGLNSKIKCYTAGGDGIGRSDTIQNLHVSELAYWGGDKEETLQGLMQAVPNLPDTLVVIESTANGMELFHDLWERAESGKSDFAAVFCGWWELPEYRMPYTGFELTDEERILKGTYSLDNKQIAWRRWCIANNCNGNIYKFKQEYPANAQEAFESASGNYFSEFNRDIHVCKPFEIPAHWRRYIALDYGLDMLAAYNIAVDEQGRAYATSEIYEPNVIISDAAERLKAWDKPYIYLAPPDLWNRRQETGRSVADIFAEQGVYLVKSSNDRVDGWMAVKEWLKPFEDVDGVTRAKLTIFENCTNLIRCIPALQYDQKNPNDVAIKPHEITHAPDALRYFCVYWTNTAVKPIEVKSQVYNPLASVKPRIESIGDNEEVAVIGY